MKKRNLFRGRRSLEGESEGELLNFSLNSNFTQSRRGGIFMLFEPMFFIVGGVTIALACLDKTLEGYGFHALGGILKIAIPLVGLAAGVYFIETNAIIWWLK